MISLLNNLEMVQLRSPKELVGSDQMPKPPLNPYLSTRIKLSHLVTAVCHFIVIMGHQVFIYSTNIHIVPILGQPLYQALGEQHGQDNGAVLRTQLSEE